MALSANPLGLSWRTLPLLLPPHGQLSGAELAAASNLAEAIDAAQQQLAELQQRLQWQQQQQAVQLQRWQRAAQARVQQDCAALRQAARAEAVAEAVQWMQDELALEQQLATQLLSRWRGVLAEGLQALLAQQDQVQWLLAQLAQQMPALWQQGRLRLHIAPAQAEVLQQALAGHAGLQLQVDAALQPGQALLDNGMVRVSLDVPAQLSWLLQQLSGNSEEDEYG